ncbi:MAG: hypothetical protein KME10_19060 [Plectolyngbya sp. WJT66-NPBG17]|jgi:hypothetical protein|nr:hypothetical protein [Plectolyngbya sp. WJT66-NPBG17]
MTKQILEETEMPETDAPNMEYVRFAVPAPLLQEALELAKAEGWKPAELHRIFWERGFAAYAEGSNKRRVNRSLRKRETEE